MLDQYLSLYRHWTLLALETQGVIALRMTRLAAGGAVAQREMHRMVAEKADAAAMAALNAAVAAATGKSAPQIASQAIRGYRKRVRANRRRLSQ